MMRKTVYLLVMLIVILTGCKDDDIAVFDKSADERSAEAIAALRQDLTSGPWKLKYTPEDNSGSYWVLLNFSGNGNVTIQSDLGADDGTYYEQTITYRIDNSLGLELILESHCMFSFLFERNQATFEAEYEFNYANKTPDNSLVFSSKTDPGTPTILVFQRANPTDEVLLGRTISTYLDSIASDFQKFSSSVRLSYKNKDLMIFLSLDQITRNVTFTSASRKSNTATLQSIDLATAYLLQGDSLILDEPLQGNYFGNNIKISSLKLSSLSESTFNGCATPMTMHAISGKTSQNDDIILETTLSDLSGRTFPEVSDFYVAPLQNIRDHGQVVVDEITASIPGALAMQLYYGYETQRGEMNSIGFIIQNSDDSFTFALREFTPVLNENHIIFNFADDITISGPDIPDSSKDAINVYLELLTQGDNTYVFKLDEGLYEFYNPCSGWSFVFFDPSDPE
ncbi:MAG TPA: DUF4302 domain-containing protein [Chryseolinea sp.]|nr:DUF4302 domain-containing protein [Chryseolinea sp.]